jgi:TolB-like protein/Flp pilus assembly protein TadD
MVFLFHTCALDTDRRELRRGAGLVRLEPQVFDLLEYLIRHRERVVTRDDLLAAVWSGRIVSESALDTRINAARTAIGDDGKRQQLIRTFPRKGIRFMAMVREEVPSAPSVPHNRAEQAAPLVLPDRPSIAVLPFVNLSGEPAEDYFGDGMAVEIITALSRCKWLFVIARNSSFIYKGRSVDVREIGRELGVRYLLEGSVRRGGDQLRVTAQLTETGTGTNVWADRFDGSREDVFALQDHITASVVAAIEPNLELAEIERLKRKAAANLDAYDLLLQARKLEADFTKDSLKDAIHTAERALAIDPSYAQPMALAAYCYAQRRFQGWTEDGDREEAEGLRLARAAIERGRDDSVVLWMSAYAVRELGMDPYRARELVRRSLHLNPNSAMALTVAAWTEVVLDDAPKALELIHRAERLSPRDPRAWFMSTAASLAYIAQGDYGRAAACAKRALAQNPHSAQALRFVAASLAQLGDIEGAAGAMRQVLTIEPRLTAGSLRARLKFMPEAVWNNLAGGLRLAGLPAGAD